MENFDKLKLASSSLGERLRTGGAQMSRIVSSKMKEILQAPTPESKIIDEATSETMEEPNWGLNLRICAMINSEQFNGTEIVKAIKKKLIGKSVVSQRLSLDLLEACTSNCEKVFSEVASEKVVDDMMKMIDDPKTDHENRMKAMQLIKAWGESEDLLYLPIFHQTYMNLKARPIHQGMQDVNMPPQYPLDSYLDQGPLSPTEESHNRENANLFSYIQSVDEKREFLVETRNSLDVLSSILNADDESKSIKNELTITLLDKCKYSLPVVQRIIETTSDEEGMLFEALSLHDDLQQVISRCQDIEAGLDSEETVSKHSDAGVLLRADPDVEEAAASDSGETKSKHSAAGVLPADPNIKEAASDSGETMSKHSGVEVIIPAEPDIKGHTSQVQSQNTIENSDFSESQSHEHDSKEPSCPPQIENHSSDEIPKAAPLQKVGV